MFNCVLLLTVVNEIILFYSKSKNPQHFSTYEVNEVKLVTSALKYMIGTGTGRLRRRCVSTAVRTAVLPHAGDRICRTAVTAVHSRSRGQSCSRTAVSIAVRCLYYAGTHAMLRQATAVPQYTRTDTDHSQGGSTHRR